jgi:predicted metal-binding protein
VAHEGAVGIMPFALVRPVYDPKVRGLCALPYEGHAKGCPNWKKHERCPPAAPLLVDCFNLAKPTWAIWYDFAFGEHVERMRVKHPDWSERQLRCCLYWQGTARKMLEVEIRKFWALQPTAMVVRCPEAMGLSVTATMAQVGVALEWPPATRTVHVALAGFGRPECFGLKMEEQP